MPVLAKHAVKPETFEETSFQAPFGTGPYLVGEVDPGKSITLKRNPSCCSSALRSAAPP